MFYQTYKFNNGIRLVHHRHPSPVGHCGLTINAGSRDETENEHGIAHLIEHALFKGTKKRRAHHIINRMEIVGGEINAYTTKEHTCIYSSFLKEDFQRSVELICDIVFHSTFPEKELALEKEIIIDEINSYKDDPSELIFDDFEEVLFNGNPIGRNILGTPKLLRKFTREDIETFIGKNYCTDQMVFTTVVDMDFEKVLKQAGRYLEKNPPRNSSRKRIPVSCNSPVEKKIDKKTHQAHFIIGCNIPAIKDERRYTLDLLNNILGGPGMNSKLNVALREKTGYAYNVESNITLYSDTGVFATYFGTDRQHIEKCTEIVLKEFARLRNNKLGSIQLSRAKRQLKGQMIIAFENKEYLMQAMGKSHLLFNGIHSSEEIQNIIEKISSDYLMEMANMVLNPENLSILSYH